ncbi:MAG: hypothetical protein Kow0042_20240 [Calditrichia bacterium]
MSKRSKKLQKISRRLTTHQLRRLQEKDVALNYEELFGSVPQERGSPYFLGFYSPAGIKYALVQYGIFELLEKKGFRDLKLSINTRDPYKQRIALYNEKRDPAHLLGELVVKRKNITIYPPFPSLILGRNFEVISVEWLCMQNPFGKFSEERPPLPGQKYPGLGLGGMILEILIIMCRRLRTAGLLNVPEHFHNAQMYTPQFRYVDPQYEGKRQAIARDLLSRYSLSMVSWAIDLGCVRQNDRPFKWFIAEQIIPLDRDLKEFFQGKDYLQFVKKTADENVYTLNEKMFAEKKQTIKYLNTCHTL